MKTFNRIAILDFDFSHEFMSSVQKYSEEPILVLNSTREIKDQDALSIDALICNWKDKINAELLQGMPKLEVISTRASSTKNIDLEYAKSRNIAVKNIFGYGDQSTAEFVVQQILSIARDINLQGVVSEVFGKSIGFLGFGHVAKKVAQPLQALGAKLCYYSPYEFITQRVRKGVPFAKKETILQCDFLSVHTPDRTESISKTDLELIGKETSLIITTMGLPMNPKVFRLWKSTTSNIVIMDKVAAGDLKFDDLCGVYVKDVYAARSVESKKEAERQVLENLS